MMTYHGRIKNGTLVLDQPVNLPDGAEVEVEVSPTQPKESQVGAALERLAGTAQDLPPDLAQRHDEYRRERKR